MDRQEIKSILVSGDTVEYHVWTFSEKFMSCNHEPSCCESDFNNVEDTLDHIEYLCDGIWEEVTYE